MTTNPNDVATLRTHIKAASSLRDELLSLWDRLKDMESAVHSLPDGAPGVQSTINLLDGVIDTLRDTLTDLRSEEDVVYASLQDMMKKR
jgi:hypothetical protein